MGLFCLFPPPGIPEFPRKHHRQGFTFIGGQLRPSHHVVPGKKGNGTLGNNTISQKKPRINPNHTKPSKSKKSQDQPQPKFPSPAPQTQGQREPDLKISFCPRVRNHPPQFPAQFPAQFLPFQDIGWEGLCTDVRHWIFFNPQVVLFQPLGCCGWCSLIAVVAHLIRKKNNKQNFNRPRTSRTLLQICAKLALWIVFEI